MWLKFNFESIVSGVGKIIFVLFVADKLFRSAGVVDELCIIGDKCVWFGIEGESGGRVAWEVERLRPGKIRFVNGLKNKDDKEKFSSLWSESIVALSLGCLEMDDIKRLKVTLGLVGWSVESEFFILLFGSNSSLSGLLNKQTFTYI